MQTLRRIDVFPKFDSQFESEARDRTVVGGVLSGAAILAIVLLVLTEARYFFTVQKHHEMFVDASSATEAAAGGGVGGGKLVVALNMTFHEVPCDLMSVDAIDSFGEYIQGVEAATVKRAVSQRTGAVAAEPHDHLQIVGAAQDASKQQPQHIAGEKRPGCGPCYGAEETPDACCNTCEEVKIAYAKKGWSVSPTDVSIVQCAEERLRHALAMKAHEGCNIVVRFVVNRVQGNLHLIPGRAFAHLGQHLHDLGGDELKTLNLTHTVHALAFGDTFPGKSSPLDGVVGVSSAHADAPDTYGLSNVKVDAAAEARKPPPFGGGKFQYFVKVAPTQYVPLRGSAIDTNQYAVTSHYTAATQVPGTDPSGMGAIPGVYFQYDLSPIVARVTERRPYASWVHFFLQLCAIAGGVFTVAGLLDAFVYHGAEQVRRKINLGKMS